MMSANFAFAQNNQENCSLETGECTAQGLELASLLENRGLSFSLIVIAGLLDGVNPCAIGMLILLLGYLLVFAHEPKRMVKLGLIYIITVFITYYLIGVVFSQIVYKSHGAFNQRTAAECNSIAAAFSPFNPFFHHLSAFPEMPPRV